MTENEIGKVVVDAAIAVNILKPIWFLASQKTKSWLQLSPDKRRRGQGAVENEIRVDINLLFFCVKGNILRTETPLLF
jgi:hypothetical protein